MVKIRAGIKSASSSSNSVARLGIPALCLGLLLSCKQRPTENALHASEDTSAADHDSHNAESVEYFVSHLPRLEVEDLKSESLNSNFQAGVKVDAGIAGAEATAVVTFDFKTEVTTKLNVVLAYHGNSQDQAVTKNEGNRIVLNLDYGDPRDRLVAECIYSTTVSSSLGQEASFYYYGNGGGVSHDTTWSQTVSSHKGLFVEREDTIDSLQKTCWGKYMAEVAPNANRELSNWVSKNLKPSGAGIELKNDTSLGAEIWEYSNDSWQKVGDLGITKTWSFGFEKNKLYNIWWGRTTCLPFRPKEIKRFELVEKALGSNGCHPINGSIGCLDVNGDDLPWEPKGYSGDCGKNL
jgi:hypothetical protein